MKQCVLIILLLIVCNVLTFSQFKEGYIIKNSNDTLFGFINWQGSAINTTQCEFRVTPDGPAEVYKPGDIKAFRFNNSKYFSTYEIKTGDQAEVVFIEWLIKGRASLLAFTGSVAEPRFFLLTEDGALTELTNTTYEFVNEGVVYQRKKQEYINTLLFNFRDCATLEPKIKATGFKSKSLLNLTKQYHELTCKTEDCIIFEDRARALVLNYGVSAGFLNSQWILNNKVPEKVYPSTTTGFGAAMSISNLPVLPPRFSVKIGLGFYSSVYSYDTADFYRVISDDRIMKVNYFKIPAQLSYRFTYSRFSPYVSAGTTFNVRFTYKQYEQILTDFITVSKYLDHYIAEVNPFQFGANAGFGFDYTVSPKLSFNLGYDFEYGFRQYGTYPDDHSKLINHNVYLRAYFVSNRK